MKDTIASHIYNDCFKTIKSLAEKYSVDEHYVAGLMMQAINIEFAS